MLFRPGGFIKQLVLALVLGATVSLACAQARPVLYEILGQRPGLQRLVDVFAELLLADARIADSFKKTKMAVFKEALTDQLCEVSGGPCHYEGNSMKAAHEELGITAAQFNALVEDLQEAMSRQQIAFRDQNRLLALLAPMHRDIVTVGR
jgi:hemoglobin